MTKEEHWEKIVKEEIKQEIFSPRIQQDLSRIEVPTLPNHVYHLAQDKGGLYIYGSVGTGKTVYASALLLGVIKTSFLENKGVPTAIVITCLELLDQLRKEIQAPASISILETVINTNLLLLDDLGTEKPSEWVLQTLNHLINSRYENLRPTIITSNFPLTVIGERLDQRLASRIYGMGKVIEFTGKDKRANHPSQTHSKPGLE
jgi:DNA replication protein DnaC